MSRTRFPYRIQGRQMGNVLLVLWLYFHPGRKPIHWACLMGMNLLLLSLPVCGQVQPSWSTWTTADAVDPTLDADHWALEVPKYRWETFKVDSLNLGTWGDTVHVTTGYRPPKGNVMGGDYTRYQTGEAVEHDWVTDLYFDPPSDPRLFIGHTRADMKRERICRICLRREWQKKERIPPPKSEFELLRERLK